MSWEAWGDPPEYPCEMCGRAAWDCICPECPRCAAVGDPECYATHGMVEADDQTQSRLSRSDELPGNLFELDPEGGGA